LFESGIIPEKEIKELESIGIGRIFTPGKNTLNKEKYLKQ